MRKSTPINQILNNNNTTLVDDILNDIGSNTESENIEERQQREKKLLEEGMERQILEQKQNEETYNDQYNEPQEETYEPQEEAYEPQEEAYEPQEEAYEPQEEAYEPQEEAYEPQEETYEPQEEAYEPQEEAQDTPNTPVDNISTDSLNEPTELNTNKFNKSSIPDSKKGKENIKEKGLMERLCDNIKPTLIVMVITLCVLSNISTQFIDKLLPNKDIFIKYNIIIVLILKSLLSGSIFFISNLLL